MNIKDITDLNLHFLMLARHLAVTDRACACSQLGLTEADIDTLVNAPLTDIVALAASRKSLVRVATPIRTVEKGSIDSIALQMTFVRGLNRASLE